MGQLPPAPPTVALASTSSDAVSCSICLEAFSADDVVTLLVCHHVFHGTCMQLWSTTASTIEPSCPLCRGDLTPIFAGPWSDAQSHMPSAHPPPAQPAAETNDWHADGGNATPPAPPTGAIDISTPDEEGFESPHDDHDGDVFMAPWWPMPPQGTSAVFHAGTALTDGRMGLLIDTGAWDNISGDQWARQVAQQAVNNKHLPSQERMNTPLEIQGVGSGSQTCEWRATLPITLPRQDGSYALDKFSFACSSFHDVESCRYGYD